MAKLLVSLALAVAQLFSWGGVPLYLCLCDSDTLCIDAGSEGCNCCDEEAAAPTRPAGCDDACDHHEHGAQLGGSPADLAAAGIQLSGTCECRHIELSLARGSAMVRTSATPKADQLGSLPAAADATTILPPILGPLAAADLARSSPPAHYASAILGSIMLRC